MALMNSTKERLRTKLQSWLLFILASYLFSTPNLFAEFSQSKPAHHLWNSRLLKPQEVEIGALPIGSIKVGVTENLELGTSIFLLLSKSPSLFLKHRMFSIGDLEMSLSSFSVYFPSKSLSSDSNLGLLSMNGLVSTYNINRSFGLNIGLQSIYALLQQKKNDINFGDVRDSSEANLIMPLVGFDYLMSRDWALTTFALIPIYSRIEYGNDFVGAEISKFFSTEDLKNLNLILYLGFTRSWDVFSLEFGVFQAYQAMVPYLNLMWRY